MEILVGGRIGRDTPGTFRTAIDRPGETGSDAGAVVLDLFFTHSRIKQHLKDGRAIRIETVTFACEIILANVPGSPVETSCGPLARRVMMNWS